VTFENLTEVDHLLLKNETVRDQMIAANPACLVCHTIGDTLYPAACRAICLYSLAGTAFRSFQMMLIGRLPACEI
jgi:hypothetical protein